MNSRCGLLIVALVFLELLIDDVVGRLKDGRQPVHTAYSEFSYIARKAAFVDKTLMLKWLFQEPEYCLITAPRRFGKTANMNMVKTFVELEHDSTGSPVTKTEYLQHPVNDTPNYRLFVDRNLKITNHTDIMEEHFGRYPVVSVTFKTSRTIKTYDDAVAFLNRVVHKSFLMHCYLTHSRSLNSVERSICETWCDVKAYKTMHVDFLTDGLHDLSRYLSQHYNGSKCYVLIDEYDELITRAIAGTSDKDELKDINGLLIEIISSVLSTNLYVARCLITGVSYIPGEGLTGMNDFYAFRFLDHHPFVEYFGVTPDEAVELFRSDRFVLSRDDVVRAISMYDGYTSRSGTKVYNLYSIVRFLQTKSVTPYWTYFANIEDLENALRFSVIRHRVVELMLGNSITIDVKEKLTMRDIIKVRQLLKGAYYEKVINSDLFFTFLLEHGYLSYASRTYSPNGVAVRLCNQEIVQEIYLQVEEYYTDICEFDKEFMKECMLFIDGISPNVSNDDVIFIEALNDFRVTLEGLFIGFSNEGCVMKFSEAELHFLMVVVFFKTKYTSFNKLKYSFWDAGVYKTIIPDLVLAGHNFGIIIEFKCRQPGNLITSKNGLKQILEREYYRVFGSEELAQFNIRNFLFMGLAIDNELLPYVSVLANSYDHKKAVHLVSKEGVFVPREIGPRTKRPKTKRGRKAFTIRKRTYRPKTKYPFDEAHCCPKCR